VATGTISLSSDTVDDNQAGTYVSGYLVASYGGGLYVGGGSVTLSGDTVDANFAGGLPGLKLSYQSKEAYGGGICIAAGTVAPSNDIIENNVAIAQGYAIGAGVYIASPATVYVDAFTLSNLVGNTRYDSYYPSGTVDNIDGTYTLN
jgi:hypothetical protein